MHAGCGKAQSQASDAGWDGLLFSDENFHTVGRTTLLQHYRWKTWILDYIYCSYSRLGRQIWLTFSQSRRLHWLPRRKLPDTRLGMATCFEAYVSTADTSTRMYYCSMPMQFPSGSLSGYSPSPMTSSGPGSGYFNSASAKGVRQPLPSSATSIIGRAENGIG